MEMGKKRLQTCCFTGHRQIPLSERTELAAMLERAVMDLYHRGVLYYGAGGAVGFDCLAAQTVLRLRDIYPNIKLILVLPCLNQTQGWRAEDVAEYERIKGQADKVTYISQQYTRDCMFKRNRRLVDYSGFCICYLTKNSGGTAYTVDYARRQGLMVVNLAKTGV